MPLTFKHLWPVLALAPVLAWAQASLRDPTMPPPGVHLANPGAAGETAGPADPVTAQPVIRITPVGGGRPQAQINGRSVQLGQTPKSWRVVNITATGVVLKDSRGSRTVSTPPDTIRKKSVSGPASEQ